MRSAAEQEIRDAVVDRLRLIRPAARICHEVNCGVWGPNRMDLIAVSPTEIVAVEIKSAKDTISRGPKQLASMSAVAHHSVIALHEVHLEERETNQWAAHYGKLNRKYYLRAVPDCLAQGRTIPWVYPEYERAAESWDVGMWRSPETKMEYALPSGALYMLWRDELAELCDSLRVSRGKRATMDQMTKALQWHCTGKELTRGICAALRRRKFAEADAPVFCETMEHV